MKPLFVTVIVCCLAAALYLVVKPQAEKESSVTYKLSAGERMLGDPTVESATPSPATKPAVPEEAERLMQRMDNLQTQLLAVVAKRQQAEAALLQAEQDVADLEDYVDAIKLRGEDPTDYADEGVARFLPAFEAYQQAVVDFEEAALAEEEIMTQLSAAEKALADHWSQPLSSH